MTEPQDDQLEEEQAESAALVPVKKKRAPSGFDPSKLSGKIGVEKSARKNYADVPRWVRLALVEYEMSDDATYESVAKKYGRKGSSLSQYARSPAMKRWRDEIRKYVENPTRLAESMLRSNIANITLDYLLAFQGAIDAGDYKEVGHMARDILDRNGVRKKEKGTPQQKPTLVINLGGGVSLEREMVETTFEAPADAVEGDYEFLDDE